MRSSGLFVYGTQHLSVDRREILMMMTVEITTSIATQLRSMSALDDLEHAPKGVHFKENLPFSDYLTHPRTICAAIRFHDSVSRTSYASRECVRLFEQLKQPNSYLHSCTMWNDDVAGGATVILGVLLQYLITLGHQPVVHQYRTACTSYPQNTYLQTQFCSCRPFQFERTMNRVNGSGAIPKPIRAGRA